MALRVFSVFLCIFFFLFSTGQACSGFAASCKRLTTTGPYLDAFCRNNVGIYLPSRQDLSKCIGVNKQGEVVCSSMTGDDIPVAGTCSYLKYLSEGTMMEAKCENDNKEVVSSTLDLNSCVGNINGHLRCSYSQDCLQVQSA